jgi:hypothetical protein
VIFSNRIDLIHEINNALNVFRTAILGPVLVLFLLQARVRATQFVYEGFDYPGGTFLETHQGGYGFHGQWSIRRFGGVGYNTYKMKVGLLNGLESTDHTHLESIGSKDFAVLQRRLALSLGTPGTTRYLAAVITIPSFSGLSPASRYWGIGLRGLSGNGPDVFVGANLNLGRFWLTSAPGNEGVAYDSPFDSPGKYVLVLKLEFFEHSHRRTLYVNPFQLEEPASGAVQESSFGGMLDFLEIISNYTFELDEIRITDTYADLFLTAPRERPRLTSADIEVAEGNSGTTKAIVHLSLSRPSNFGVWADFTMWPESADESDFIQTEGTAFFPPGTTAAEVEIEVKGDLEVEAPENFYLRFSPTSGAGPEFSYVDVHVNILNDDIAPPLLSVARDTGPSVRILWNSGSPPFVLEESISAAPGTWLPVQPAIYTDVQSEVKLPSTGKSRFFRLKSQ